MKQQIIEDFFEHTEYDRCGVELYALPDESAPGAGSLYEYLRARQILAGVGSGQDYGSHADVVANVAVTDDFKIVVFTPEGALARGQDAEEFFQGLAYSFKCMVVIDEEVSFSPGADMDAYADSDQQPGLDVTLHVTGNNNPAAAYLPLLEQDSAHPFGITDERVFFTLDPGMRASSTICAMDRQSLPLVSFQRHGLARTVAVSLTDSGEDDLAIIAHPPYRSTYSDQLVHREIANIELPSAPRDVANTPASSRPSDLDILNYAVVFGPAVSLSQHLHEFLDGRYPKGLKKVPTEVLTAVHSLAEHAEKLVADTRNTPILRASLFETCARALGFGSTLLAVIKTFEVQELRSDAPSYAGVPVTTVEPAPPTSTIKAATFGVALEAVHQRAVKNSTRNPRSLRVRVMRNDPLQRFMPWGQFAVASLFAGFFVALMVSPSFAAALDMASPSDKVFVGVISGLWLLWALFFLALAGPSRRATAHLRKAHEDGVYPYEL